ncbi:hypothetical protein GCM10010495_20220 [Kitasatospora herbaricolor]|nr:hypothetical protein GCM10010495_20220 [Kitasatospora herbaricolor]
MEAYSSISSAALVSGVAAGRLETSDGVLEASDMSQSSHEASGPGARRSRPGGGPLAPARGTGTEPTAKPGNSGKD